MFTGIEKIINVFSEYEMLREGLDVNMEIERLYSVVDGLAVHALFEGERLDSKRVIQTLVYHLNSILKVDMALDMPEK